MSNTPNLYTKMAAIMGEITRVPKTGRNKQQNYDFATDSDIADLIRGKLAAHGIAFFASMTDVEQTEIKSAKGSTGYHTIAHLEFTFVCGDTGDKMSCTWRGEADDWGDKGVSKAATLGEKYFLLKTFVMSTGDPADDPDNSGVSEADGVQRGRSKPPTPPRNGKSAAPAEEHWAKNPERAAAFYKWATEDQAVPSADLLAAFGVKRLSEIAEDEHAAKVKVEALVLARQEQPDPKEAA